MVIIINTIGIELSFQRSISITKTFQNNDEIPHQNTIIVLALFERDDICMNMLTIQRGISNSPELKSKWNLSQSIYRKTMKRITFRRQTIIAHTYSMHVKTVENPISWQLLLYDCVYM